MYNNINGNINTIYSNLTNYENNDDIAQLNSADSQANNILSSLPYLLGTQLESDIIGISDYYQKLTKTFENILLNLNEKLIKS